MSGARPDLNDFEALVFDCYGTLVDWETGIADSLGPWLVRAGVTVDRDDLLEVFGRLELEQESKTPRLPYPRILERVHASLARHFRVAPDRRAARSFASSVGDWPPFPDSAAALARLTRRFRLAVLSNVDRESFARSAARLGDPFDVVVTAEDVGTYKPDPRGFHRVLETLAEGGIGAARVLHVAQSRFHDIVPAGRLGLATCWIDRRHSLPGPGATPSVGGEARADFRFRGLEELARAVDATAARR